MGKSHFKVRSHSSVSQTIAALNVTKIFPFIKYHLQSPHMQEDVRHNSLGRQGITSVKNCALNESLDFGLETSSPEQQQLQLTSQHSWQQQLKIPISKVTEHYNAKLNAHIHGCDSLVGLISLPVS